MAFGRDRPEPGGGRGTARADRQPGSSARAAGAGGAPPPVVALGRSGRCCHPSSSCIHNLIASDCLCGRYPMGRINCGINATSGSAPLGSAVYFTCRHVLYGHRHLLAGISTLAARNKQMLHDARSGDQVINDDYWSLSPARPACGPGRDRPELGRPHPHRGGRQAEEQFARRMQDIESDTGYDTRRRASDGAISRLSQTTVYDTC